MDESKFNNKKAKLIPVEDLFIKDDGGTNPSHVKSVTEELLYLEEARNYKTKMSVFENIDKLMKVRANAAGHARNSGLDESKKESALKYIALLEKDICKLLNIRI